MFAYGKNLPIASLSKEFKSHAYSFSLYGFKNFSTIDLPNFPYSISKKFS